MAGSEVGPKREHGQRGVENVSGVASSLALSEFGSPVQQVNNSSHAGDHDHTEVAIGADAYDDSDLDSALGLERRDSTATVSSEAFKPVEKHGRRYHGYQEGKYLLPNDEQEQDRLDLQHHLFGITLSRRLHLVRLPAIHRVLDIGTGTGIWSIRFADEHPDVKVCGVDLSPIQPRWVPSNCEFQIDDLSLSWTFEFPFDFIYGRMLFCSFSDPLHVFREAFKALTAGGIIEMQDLIFDFRSDDDSLKGSALETWAKKVKEAFGSKGIDLTSASRYRNYLENVGFEDIQQQKFIWPVGTWPDDQDSKTLGSWCRENILKMLFAISIVPLTEQQHSMSEEAVQLLLARVREDLRDPKIHAYLQM
ncbi:methyltransferase domain-containing protein [Cadophora sp. MPI-SDFR-AT-0126]|nr:methyltransferase domain-containing protein [Leotiomycetes sp. MPI-SDFR-AT-0126]